MISIAHFGRLMKYLGMQMPMCSLEHMKPVPVWGCKDMIDFMYSIIFFYNPDNRRIEYMIDDAKYRVTKQILFTLTVRFAPKSYVANGSVYIPEHIQPTWFLMNPITRKLGFIRETPQYEYLTNMSCLNTSPINNTNQMVNKLQDPILLLKALIEFNDIVNSSGVYDLDYGTQRDQYNDVAERLVAIYDIKFSRFLPERYAMEGDE